MTSFPVAPAMTEYLYRKAASLGAPLSGTFELTPLCNMDCQMCYVKLHKEQQEKKGPLKDAASWLKLAEEAKEAGMLYLLLTGGEPFLHPQIREILEGLNQMGFILSLNTNGTLIDEETVKWLKNCPPFRINVSLYGASDETYSRLCKNPKGFTQTKKAISLLKEAGISVKLNVSLTPENASDLEEMVAFSKENDLILQVATYMFPPIRKNEAMVGKNNRFPPEEAAYYMALSDYLLLGEKRFLAQEGNCPSPSDMQDPCPDTGDGVRCRAGKCSFWITWQGEMLPCGMVQEENSPNVFQVPFSKAWETVKEQISAVRLPAACASCKAKDTCRACAAMVKTESGCFDKVPQYRCDMMKAYQTQWLRVKEEML